MLLRNVRLETKFLWQIKFTQSQSGKCLRSVFSLMKDYSTHSKENNQSDGGNDDRVRQTSQQSLIGRPKNERSHNQPNSSALHSLRNFHVQQVGYHNRNPPTDQERGKSEYPRYSNDTRMGEQVIGYGEIFLL